MDKIIFSKISNASFLFKLLSKDFPDTDSKLFRCLRGKLNFININILLPKEFSFAKKLHIHHYIFLYQFE